jgi:RHS repeat-associated protein
MFSADPYANRFLYTGREFLKEANLDDYRNRTYSPDLGRFLLTDPIRFDAEDVNLYRYVFNLPILLNDPTGEIAAVAIYIGAKAIKGGIAGAVGGYTSALAGQAQSRPSCQMSRERTTRLFSTIQGTSPKTGIPVGQ